MSRLSIGAVAEATGLSVYALRYFEHEGLFPRDIPRDTGGRRVYGQPDVDWLLLCNRLRESGMPIAVIKRFVDLVREGAGNEADRLALLRQHEADVRAKIDELHACLTVIHRKVVSYEKHFAEGTATGLWETS
ncbi:MerR family transcriptional regulator [Phytomonospora endophytica]|uniref:DNA-binding transcriptional MerR regulator n=1 Tax=Phytomonospora endophytica TaxID=714109 RepID=A0A841FP20_9ACTN|nr:MerR family transcriptional regulator [Phytomonospora endophytica]MBB6035302.1 DNA-binding transcriptional MerR regulator [Phytomonospora endophytica]GIG63949.1 MerR family transcriptional regulator [Phytomonospora endophytica]